MNMKMKTKDIESGGVARRFPAEWESHECVMLAWPHEETDWAYMLEEARDCFEALVKAISERECVLLVGPAELCRESVEACGFDRSRVKFVDVPTNDTWARDFGVLTVEESGEWKLLDFKFNGWGLKFASDRDNLVNSRLDWKCERENRLNFVLEGGSIESDGEGTMLTTSECLLSPNRNGEWGREEIEEYLKGAFGVSRVMWLDHGALAGDDTDSHVDTLARLAPHNTIIYVGPGDESDPNSEHLKRMREQIMTLRTEAGEPYNLIELPLPDAVFDEDGEQLPATYANYLVGPTAVYMPTYDQPMKDFLAAQMLKIAYPDREIVEVDCRALIKQHGSLHCVTMQLPCGAVNGARIENNRWV